MALGSDHPIERSSAAEILWAAQAREGREGQQLGRKGERLSAAQALEGLTLGPARLIGEPSQGRLGAGSVADFAVWDRDLRRCTPQECAAARCRAVVVDAKLRWIAS